MGRLCPITQKKPRRGYTYTIRGIAKKKKGIGLKVTGKTKRRFLPNLQQRRLWFAAENRFVTLTLTAAALRTIDKCGMETVIRDMRKQGLTV